MNRAQRRTGIRKLPRELRKPMSGDLLPILTVTPEQLAQAGLKGATGDTLLAHGKRWNVATGALEACAKGEETPFKLNVIEAEPAIH